MAGVLHKVSLLADRTVKDIEATYVAPLKLAGKFGASEAASAKMQAVHAIRSYLGAHGLRDLCAVLGDDLASARFVGAAVEAALMDAKVAATASPTVFIEQGAS